MTAIRPYTNEDAQDTIAALLAAGTHAGITFAYNDAAGTLSATVTAGAGGNIDGGTATSIYGGVTSINAGGA
jgi:hypothetical protein